MESHDYTIFLSVWLLHEHEKADMTANTYPLSLSVILELPTAISNMRFACSVSP